MKYALYAYGNRSRCNLGDSMQILALENIYNEMGIPSHEIIRIDGHSLYRYRGEKLLLPICSILPSSLFSFGVGSGDKLKFSPDITPVYLAFVTMGPLNEKDAKYLEKYQPIGCRDYYTYRECTKLGLEAYVNGCLTLTFPRRTDFEQTKIFFVDMESDLSSFIPADVKERAIHFSHLIEEADNNFDVLKRTRHVLNMYSNEAKLVITRRLHCATPCVALGVPVIYATKVLTTTMSFLDRLIPLFTPDLYSTIDFDNPAQPDGNEIEEHKHKVKELVKSRLRAVADSNHYATEVHDYFSAYQRNMSDYLVHFQVFSRVKSIKQDEKEGFTYSFYGFSNAIGVIFSFMRRNYPNANLTHIYDKYKAGFVFKGMIVESIEEISLRLEEFCIITATTPSTHQEMTDVLLNMGKPTGTFV